MNFVRLLFGLASSALIMAVFFAFMAMAIKPGDRSAQTDKVTASPERGIEQPQAPTIEEPKRPELKIPEIKIPEKGDAPNVRGIFGDEALMDTAPGPIYRRSDLHTPRPSIKVAPQYPKRCLSRGKEGTVLVEFDLTADGSVINPRIIYSTNSCFNRTALQAISKWKYQPALRNGKAVMWYGAVERFSFQPSE